ncbi:MAG: nicotinate (nicotinamide) nucleotide adenylyltransferase [Thermotogae bacterium]|nr:nicotinate (nicotinamide) nucleotide adenylyltransferase [Thermotogota bacterium]
MKICIFGGSFNPPHLGHVLISMFVKEQFAFERFVIIPSYIPPHKENEKIATFEKRFEWLNRIFEDVSDIERRLGGKSYTLKTLRYIKDETPDSKLYLLIGEDSFHNLPTWHEYEKIFDLSDIIVYPRFCEKNYMNDLKITLKKYWQRIIFLDTPLIQISSTLIRERVKEGKDVSHMLPASILEDVINTYTER